MLDYPADITETGDRVTADASLFFGLWLQKPLRIAAANPSGARLADAIAGLVDLSRPGPVLELGAGTGGLTRGLLRAGCRPERILAVEREPRLAAVLRREFPEMTILEGDATRIDEHPEIRGQRLCAVVSSLPINGSRRVSNTPSSGRASVASDRAEGLSS